MKAKKTNIQTAFTIPRTLFSGVKNLAKEENRSVSKTFAILVGEAYQNRLHLKEISQKNQK